MAEKGQEKAEDAPPKAKWPWIVGGLVTLVFLVIVLVLIFAPHAHQKTDDAYIEAHYSVIAPRIPGQIASISVTDNQSVRAGQLLVSIDDRDVRTSLERAQAMLATDRARVIYADAQVRRQPAMIREARAQVDSAAARLDLARDDARRFTNLAATGAGTTQQKDQAGSSLRQSEAELASARAQYTAAQRQLEALQADLMAARAGVAADEAQVDQAKLNVSYASLLAPIDGVVDQRSIEVGNYVGPGSPVMVVVPLDGVYVTANYREPALRHMRPGQRVLIHLDAYNVDLDGIVDSLPGASGAAYSPIPPNNATGNFTKIVQRFPVKIVFAPNQRLARLARVGMSVETTVDTHLEDIVGEQTRHDVRMTARP